MGFESGVGAVLRLLQEVDASDELGRFVRCYPGEKSLHSFSSLADRRPIVFSLGAADGTHFLDAFYAPLLMRLHIVNVFASSVWNKTQFDFAGQFKVNAANPFVSLCLKSLQDVEFVAPENAGMGFVRASARI